MLLQDSPGAVTVYLARFIARSNASMNPGFKDAGSRQWTKAAYPSGMPMPGRIQTDTDKAWLLKPRCAVCGDAAEIRDAVPRGHAHTHDDAVSEQEPPIGPGCGYVFVCDCVCMCVCIYIYTYICIMCVYYVYIHGDR